MSRISNAPVIIPKGVEATLSESSIAVKGSKGSLSLVLHHLVSVERNDENLKVSGKDDSRESGSMAGTFRSLINNMVVGVSEGYQKKLELPYIQSLQLKEDAGGNAELLSLYKKLKMTLVKRPHDIPGYTLLVKACLSLNKYSEARIAQEILQLDLQWRGWLQ